MWQYAAETSETKNIQHQPTMVSIDTRERNIHFVDFHSRTSKPIVYFSPKETFAPTKGTNFSVCQQLSFVGLFANAYSLEKEYEIYG